VGKEWRDFRIADIREKGKEARAQNEKAIEHRLRNRSNVALKGKISSIAKAKKKTKMLWQVKTLKREDQVSQTEKSKKASLCRSKKPEGRANRRAGGGWNF